MCSLLFNIDIPTARDWIATYIARTKPGTDFPTRLQTLLSQTQGERRDSSEEDLISDAADDGDEGPEVESAKRLTVREVLKYSLTWVIIPSVTVHACTQEIERLLSQPSTRTMGPNEVID